MAAAGAAEATAAVTTLNEQILLADEEPQGEDEQPARPCRCRDPERTGHRPVHGRDGAFGVWPEPLIDFADKATLLFLPH